VTADLDLERDLRASLARLEASLGDAVGDRLDVERRVVRRRRRARARLAGGALAAAAAVLFTAAVIAGGESRPQQLDMADDGAPVTSPPETTGSRSLTVEEYVVRFQDVLVPDDGLCPVNLVVLPTPGAPYDAVVTPSTGPEVVCSGAGGDVRIAFLSDPDGDGPESTSAQWAATGGSLEFVHLPDGTRAIGSGPFGPYGGGLTYVSDDTEIRLYGQASLDDLVSLAASLRPVTAEDYPTFAGHIEYWSPPGRPLTDDDQLSDGRPFQIDQDGQVIVTTTP
jgi:hypothetical protein